MLSEDYGYNLDIINQYSTCPSRINSDKQEPDIEFYDKTHSVNKWLNHEEEYFLDKTYNNTEIYTKKRPDSEFYNYWTSDNLGYHPNALQEYSSTFSLSDKLEDTYVYKDDSHYTDKLEDNKEYFYTEMKPVNFNGAESAMSKYNTMFKIHTIDPPKKQNFLKKIWKYLK